MKLFILLAIILLILFLYFVYLKPPAGRYLGPISDHFNGKVFFNPNHPQERKTITDLFKWWFNRHRKQWPTEVANLPHPPLTTVIEPAKVQVTFINHSTFLIQTKNSNFLTDPIWSERASPFSFLGPKRVRAPGISFDELPKIDFVLISHNHYDHLDIGTLLKLRDRFHPVFIVPLGNKIFLKNLGILNVIELDWWQSYSLPNVNITFLPAEHWSARWLNDRFFTLWGSYGVEIENKKIYFAGDTGYGNHFTSISQRWGTPDLAFLPIGSYLPRWFMKNNHLDPEEAIKSHLDLHAAHSIAMHFGTFQLSDEAIDQPMIDLKAGLLKYKIAPDTFLILNEGESKVF